MIVHNQPSVHLRSFKASCSLACVRGTICFIVVRSVRSEFTLQYLSMTWLFTENFVLVLKKNVSSVSLFVANTSLATFRNEKKYIFRSETAVKLRWTISRVTVTDFEIPQIKVLLLSFKRVFQ